MAYNPISGFTLQVITQTGQVASDYYLKFYEANTTTPLSMATDSTGGTLLVKAKINDSGFPISNPLDNSTVFIPHMNADYRLVVYLNEADADADATGSAYVNIPVVSTLVGTSALGTSAYLDTGTAAGELPTNADLPTVLSPYLGKNLIINGDFSVNQRKVTGTVVLAAGIYGHDRFKAGASGCTYTFATSAGVTTLTITAGSLQHVIEATDLPATDVILSWTGTAQGKIDAGSYGASGTVTDTTTGGANVTVEFNTGTLAHVQLEIGDTATDFEYVNPADQLVRCQRYFQKSDGQERDRVFAHYGLEDRYGWVDFVSQMRNTPLVTQTILALFENGADLTGSITSNSVVGANAIGFGSVVKSSVTTNQGGAALAYLTWEADAEL